MSDDEQEPLSGNGYEYKGDWENEGVPRGTPLGAHERDSHPARCTANRSDGVTPCRRYAAKGQEKCLKHGAGTAAAKAAARRRLDDAADRMAKLLLRMATGAESETVKLAAIRDALDRAGLKPPTQVEVGVQPYQEVFQAMSGGIAAISQAESRARRYGTPQPPPPAAIAPAGSTVGADDVVDAEVVEDGPSSPATPQERPAWATDTPRPTNQLQTMEDALSDLAAIRRNQAQQRRRQKR